MNFWQGKRVRMRWMEPEDGEFLYALSQDTEAQKGVIATIAPPKSLAACKKEAQEASLKRPSDDAFQLVIENEAGEPIGLINSHGIRRRPRVFGYGLQVLREHRRKGYAREAAVLLLRYFFDMLGYQKCNTAVFSFNEPSARFHESLGFIREGCRRRTEFVDGRYHDCRLYGITVEEFRAKHGVPTVESGGEGAA